MRTIRNISFLILVAAAVATGQTKVLANGSGLAQYLASEQAQCGGNFYFTGYGICGGGFAANGINGCDVTGFGGACAQMCRGTSEYSESYDLYYTGTTYVWEIDMGVMTLVDTIPGSFEDEIFGPGMTYFSGDGMDYDRSRSGYNSMAGTSYALCRCNDCEDR